MEVESIGYSNYVNKQAGRWKDMSQITWPQLKWETQKKGPTGEMRTSLWGTEAPKDMAKVTGTTEQSGPRKTNKQMSFS